MRTFVIPVALVLAAALVVGCQDTPTSPNVDGLGPELVVSNRPVCPPLGFTLVDFTDFPDGTITEDDKVCEKRGPREGQPIRVDNSPGPIIIS